ANAAGALTAGVILELRNVLHANPKTAFILVILWCLCIGGFALSNVYLLSLALLFAAGFLNLAFGAMAQTLVQLHAPATIRGCGSWARSAAHECAGPPLGASLWAGAAPLWGAVGRSGCWPPSCSSAPPLCSPSTCARSAPRRRSKVGKSPAVAAARCGAGRSY